MTNIKKLVVTAMLIALCVISPMAFHSIAMAGQILLPMHVPILLAGLVCGWKFGLIAGVAAPILSSSITGMPAAAIVPMMAIELGTYGLVAGLVLQFVRTRRASFDLYIALTVALFVGRIVAGISQYVYFFEGAFVEFLDFWAATYFVKAVPGLVIQFAFVPSVVMALERERVIPLRYSANA